MTKWSTEQLVFVTTAYLSQGKSIVSVQRSFKTKFNMRSSPSKKVIYRAVNNFSSTGNLEKMKPGRSAATATAVPNVEKAKEIIGENPNVSKMFPIWIFSNVIRNVILWCFQTSAILPARWGNLSHHKRKHVSSAKSFSRTCDFKIWWHRMACQVPRSFPTWFFLVGIPKG